MKYDYVHFHDQILSKLRIYVLNSFTYITDMMSSTWIPDYIYITVHDTSIRKKLKCVSTGSQYNDRAFWRFIFETAIMDLFFRSILMMNNIAWCILKYPLIWIMTGDCLGFINLEAGFIIYLYVQWKRFLHPLAYVALHILSFLLFFILDF